MTSFGFLAIILTSMPYISVDFWWVRIFDFPHLQLTLLTALAIATYIIKFDFKDYRDYIFISALIACFIFQFIKIYPYTTFAKYEVLNATNPVKKPFSVLTANVLQENENTDMVMKEIDTMDADVVLFTEVNNRWLKAINQNISNNYRYSVKYPLDNTYGMAMYSKLPLINPKVKFLVSDSIPSIHTKVILNQKDTIQIYCIHPTPPMPQENPMSTDRDTEMMQIALLSSASKYAVVVMGDFNDVAWSQTSKLFKNVSTLLDVRLGRGFFSTYSAKSSILRWPLDHVFISEEFRHIKTQTCSDINSDHFPFYAQLSFEPDIAEEQRPNPPTKLEIERAKKQAERSKNSN